MIITVTANPSLDRTVTLDGTLNRGEVHRLASTTVEAGGKGVNVARAIHAAGRPVLALLPASQNDPILGLLDGLEISHGEVQVDSSTRMNITLTEPDGTTTKLNEPGSTFTPEQLTAFEQLILQATDGASWVVLAGSLPPGIPTDWYATLVPKLKAFGCKVAVDTSDAPLLALADGFPASAPDLLKPNSEELAQLSGADGQVLEASAESGDIRAVVEAAKTLVDQGVGAVLATLGGAGAVLVTAATVLRAIPPRIAVKSTVGAGDSSVSGFILADVAGKPVDQCLATAVAYGSAAASLAGSALPRPDQVDPSVVVIEPC